MHPYHMALRHALIKKNVVGAEKEQVQKKLSMKRLPAVCPKNNKSPKGARSKAGRGKAHRREPRLPPLETTLPPLWEGKKIRRD